MEANQIQTRTLIISLAVIASVECSVRLLAAKQFVDSMIILGAARLLEVILIILFLLIWGQGISSIGLAPSNMAAGFKKGLIWSAGFGTVAFLVYVVLTMGGINVMAFIQARLPTKQWQIALFFFVGGILGPTAEEVVFRGILYGFFRRWGVGLAVLLSTLLFVLAHRVSHGIFVPQVVGGIVFAVAYEVQGSLLTPITIHILGNMAIFSLALVA
jgi:membrane protease YdiL (CAAX protease family)